MINEINVIIPTYYIKQTEQVCYCMRSEVDRKTARRVGFFMLVLLVSFNMLFSVLLAFFVYILQM